MNTHTLRLFLALAIPGDRRLALDTAVEPLRRHGRAVRWVRQDLWHLTLIFLGERPSSLVDAILQSAGTACSTTAPFTLQLGGVGCFPHAGRPRVLWVGVQVGAAELTALHARLFTALGVSDIDVQSESFSAHLTVGRLRDDTDPAGRAEVGRAWTTVTLPYLPAFEARELHLMQSVLGPSGPSYASLAALPFGGATT